MDIVIRFMFIVGRRRMAARLETKLNVSTVPFSTKNLTSPDSHCLKVYLK